MMRYFERWVVRNAERVADLYALAEIESEP
jgi:hypothetical protein